MHYISKTRVVLLLLKKNLNLQILIDYLETLLYNKKIRESLINNMKKIQI